MKKYESWMNLKEEINDVSNSLYFHERQIWFIFLGKNIGYEQNGSGSKFLRPVVILKKFNNSLCLVIPLTNTKKTGSYYYDFVYRGKVSIAILSQIRLVDSKRLKYRKGNINKQDFLELKKKLIRVIL